VNLQVLADVGSQMPDSTRAFFAAELLKVVCEVSTHCIAMSVRYAFD